jgi:hypothetical protein
MEGAGLGGPIPPFFLGEKVGFGLVWGFVWVLAVFFGCFGVWFATESHLYCYCARALVFVGRYPSSLFFSGHRPSISR